MHCSCRLSNQSSANPLRNNGIERVDPRCSNADSLDVGLSVVCEGRERWSAVYRVADCSFSPSGSLNVDGERTVPHHYYIAHISRVSDCSSGFPPKLYCWRYISYSVTEDSSLLEFCSPHSNWFRLRNDLYCVEWDVKLCYTIPYLSRHQHNCMVCTVDRLSLSRIYS